MRFEEVELAFEQVEAYLRNLQKRICFCLSQEDSVADFSENPWHQENFGYGLTRVLEDGAVFEKAGVNFSAIEGHTLPSSASALRPQLAGASFRVVGLSLVVHPDNPFIPTSHANLRFFVAFPKDADPVWWFGGGFDLTPYYGYEEDCRHWHQVAKKACRVLGEEAYPKYKAWCDKYFYIPHRQEPRGIGGLFFDDVASPDFETCFAFIRAVGDGYLEAYQPIVAKRKTEPFDERQKRFQAYRRGRYVEFNLVYDRGTLFGLQTQGRTEAILMSLPPVVHWQYDWRPNPGSPEEKLYTDFLIARDWVQS